MKKISCILIIFLTVVFFSCGGGGGGSNTGKTGTLIVNISNESGGVNRLILPEGEMTPHTYVITGKGPAFNTFTRTISGESAAEIQGLVFGEWTIHVEALNENNISIGDGEGMVVIHSGETATCTVPVTPFSGMGTLELFIGWDEQVTNPHLEITLSRKGYDPFEVPYRLNSVLGRAEVNTEVDAGYYTLTIDLYDESGGLEPHIGGAVEVVRIAQGMISSQTITIQTGSNPGGDGGIGGIDNPGFPSPGAPVGSDAVSSSTNHSGKEAETSPKLNPLAGAAFVQAPQIGNYGSVSLSYAVDVPAGRAGMQPGVGLSYSSSGGDGIAGIGWSLNTGLGVISRATRHGELCYDYRDIFTYNGKRLVKVAGPSRSENGVYRQEIESGFSRFELTDAENGGVWRVYDKSGTVTVFGEDIDSRVYRPDNAHRTYIWNFSRSYDLNGNYMQAVYDTSRYNENHILYLKEIRYTGNYRNSTYPRQYVKFSYKARSDAYVSKSPGFIMKMDRLLDVIEVGWDSAKLWHYTMVYETSADSGRPILKTVNSTRNTTQPEFTYQPAQHNFVWNLVNNRDYSQYTDPSKVKYFEGDFNGDGLSDMVFFNPDTGLWKAAECRGDGGYNFPTYGNAFRGYDSELKIKFFKGNVTGDYNGDGRSDIAFYLPETKDFIVAEHNGQVFGFKNYGRLNLPNGLDIFKCEWFTGDYDGNGLSDAVLFDEKTGDWWLMANMGGRFSFVKFSKHFQNLFREDYSPDSNMDSLYTNDTSDSGKHRGKVYFFTGDYNGDGRTDISIYDSRDGRWWVAENYKTPGTTPPNPPLAGGATVAFKLEWKLYKVFTAPEQALFSNDRFTGDFNGDGFSDFMLFDRSTGQWILGETGNGTIDFRIVSRAPQFKDITRWLQGDFNGDGRTDIGFYSKTDNNFWIGEATPDGFRYRIYSNLSYGPDPARVLRTPLPKDEIDIKTARAILSNDSSTTVLEYKYDGNIHSGKGEKVFAGNFDGPGALYYRKNASGDLPKGWYYSATDTASGTNGAIYMAGNNFNFDPEGTNIHILNSGKPYRDSSGKDGILYYDNSSDQFRLLNTNMNGQWQNNPIGTHSGFDTDTGLYMVGDFSNNNVYEYPDSALVLGTETGEPCFYLLKNGVAHIYEIRYPGSSADILRNIFSNYASAKQGVRIFTGQFNSGSNEYHFLIADTRAGAHKWFAGRVDTSAGDIFFDELTGDNFTPSGYTGIYRFNNATNNIIYSTLNSGRLQFHKISFSTIFNQLSVDSYNALTGVTFNGEFDFNNNPVVQDGSAYKYFNLATGGLVVLDPDASQNDGYVKAVCERSDLMNNYYPFQWIQGDYNGDGKTDIGIFNLAERTWYFANTTGTVPDLISEVENGIGGNYRMTYINSSSLDNRGDDGLPHLPMNYKVCNSLTVEDGQGNRVVTKYEYRKGYAFSAFINGFKETDYFGFGEFRVIDAYGSRSISEYNNVLYNDYRMNRALAGAIKTSRYVGYDGIEYSRTDYDYKIHEIATSSPYPQPPAPNGEPRYAASYLIEPVEVRAYKKNTLTETRRSNIVLTAREYAMESKTESVTDHYRDTVHAETTVSNYTEYENIDVTNEMRARLKRKFAGSANETTSEYQYDNRGNLTQEVLRYTGSGLDNAASRVMVYEYDNFGNRTRETDRSATPFRITERSFEDESRLYQFAAEEHNWTGSMFLVTKFKRNYDSAFGQIAAKTDPNGNSTYFDYDKYGRLFRQRADTDFGDRRTLNEYTYGSAFPLSAKLVQYTGTTDREMQTRVFADGMGRTIHSVRSAGPNTGNRLFTKTGLLTYDNAGRLIRKSQTGWAGNDEIDVYKPNSNEKYPTKYEYDAAGRQKRVIQPVAYAGEPETSVIYTYNDPWEVVSEHSVGRSKRTVTNSRGLVLYVEDYGRGDDNQEANAVTGFAYDIAGNRVKKMDLNNTAMSLAIDTGLFRAGVKDTSGSNICQWRYDGFGRVTASSDADLGYTAVEYNAFGDVVERTDGLDRSISMSYDSLGRITQKTLPGSEGTVHYTYDTGTESLNSLGKIVDIDDPSQKKTFSYDKMGRIDKETRVIKTSPPNPPGGGLSAYITTFEYDLLNRKRTIVYPRDPRSGTSITAKYSYSSMGATAVEVYNNTGRKDIISGVLFNEFGQMTEVTRGNGTDTHYSYDIKGRLTNLVTYTVSNNQTRKLQDVSYTFKIDNSISSTLNTPDIDTNGGYLSTVRYNYKYDGLNRLVKAAGLYTKSSMPNSGTQDIVNRFESGFQYAPNGNMTGRDILDPATHSVQESLTYAYGENNHAVTGITSSTTGERYRMSYDAVGNMISQTGPQAPQTPLEGGSPLNPPGGDLTAKAMEYDSFNRITKVTSPDAGNEVVGQYWYDDQGFRVRKLAKRKVAGEDRQVEVLYPSMYFGLEKHRTTSGTEIPNTTYAVNNIYLDGVRIAAVIPNGDARYYFTDQVDSVKVVADDNGRAVTRMEYMPYGETWFTEGDNNNSPKYNSQELDKESNLYYYNARHYDAGVARFVTADTVIDGEYDTQGWNRYAYCHNNPIRYKDPSGHFLGIPFFETKMGNDEMKPSLKSSSKELKETSDSLKQDGKTINELVDKALNNVSDKKTANGAKVGKNVVDNVSKQACLAASYYELLKASKVDNLEKSFDDFLTNQMKSKNIDKDSGYVKSGDKIVSNYTKDGRALQLGSIQVKVDGNNQVVDKKEQKEKYQQYLNRTKKTDVGIVSITDPHSMLEYKNDKNEKVITDTAQREHGSSSSRSVNEGNFRAYYWLEYDDKKKK